MLTLYHWDMPASLAAAGGWDNRDSIQWFTRYANVVFANFADQVDLFVLVNEPAIERDIKTTAEERLAGQPGQLRLLPDEAHLAVSLNTYNHILVASASAKESFTAKGYKGRLGIALPLLPALTADNASPADRAAATFGDGVLNRWFLDALYKGSYPADILALAEQKGMQLDVQPGDAARIYAAHFDYLGVNYYAPAFYRQPAGTTDVSAAEYYRPNGVDSAFNGPVRPDQFKALLDRIRVDYGNPTVFITENGAGFPGDDLLVHGAVRDIRRCRYIVSHVTAMQQAIAAGGRCSRLPSLVQPRQPRVVQRLRQSLRPHLRRLRHATANPQAKRLHLHPPDPRRTPHARSLRQLIRHLHSQAEGGCPIHDGSTVMGGSFGRPPRWRNSLGTDIQSEEAKETTRDPKR